MNPKTAARRWFDDSTLAPLGDGHIHDTFLLKAQNQQYVLQRINEVVFVDAELVMKQTQRLLLQWRKQERYAAPELCVSQSGAVCERVEGALWRLWRYVPQTRVIDPITHLGQARAAGCAFAALQKSLADLPGQSFDDTIDGFLQLEHYLRAYDSVANTAPSDLDKLIQDNLALAQQLGQRNAHIHGDCKVNNLLFDLAGDDVVAIIDFDTAMYGHWAWDFGDLVRSVCFSREKVEVDYFAACLSGFAQHQSLANVQDAVAAPGYVALMLGVRFLTDHLTGDHYFRVAQHGENLVRAREQFALFEAFFADGDRLTEVAESVLSERQNSI